MFIESQLFLPLLYQLSQIFYKKKKNRRHHFKHLSIIWELMKNKCVYLWKINNISNYIQMLLCSVVTLFSWAKLLFSGYIGKC